MEFKGVADGKDMREKSRVNPKSFVQTPGGMELPSTDEEGLGGKDRHFHFGCVNLLMLM